MEQEKILANDISDKGLISKIHKKLIQLNTKKHTKSNVKIEDLNRQFSQQDTVGQQIYGQVLNTANHQGNAR